MLRILHLIRQPTAATFPSRGRLLIFTLLFMCALVDPDATHRPTGSTPLRSAQDDTRGSVERNVSLHKNFTCSKVFWCYLFFKKGNEKIPNTN